MLQTGRVFARRNEDEHPACLLYRTALGRQSKSPSLAKTVTAAAWSVRVNNRSYRTDGTYSKRAVPSYGVRLLELAAEWSPQAF